MFDSEFFPTPWQIAIDMRERANIDAKSHVLEPSAGKGDLLDKIKERTRYVYAIEKSPELAALLRGKGYKVVHDDFLTYRKELEFDAVIMNPPFSNADEHFLKAWEVVKDGGTVVCIMNAETWNKPFSEKRKLLRSIVEANGEAIELGQCFKASERKTDVDVVMVVAKKPEKESYDFGHFEEEKVEFSDIASNELASRDAVDTICRQYEQVKRIYAEGYAMIAKAGRIGREISKNHNFKPFEISANSSGGTEAVNELMTQLKIGVWENIAEELKLEKYMTDKVRQDFRNRMKEQGSMAITPENIRTFVQAILTNAGTFLEDCVVEVFDSFTKFHEENRVHVEGWVTNSSWKVKKRVILPYFVSTRWSGGFEVPYNKSNSVSDIDRAMCYLTGKRYDDIDRIEPKLKVAKAGVKYETEFFFFRAYIKGTLHLEFKDPKLLETFNIRVALKRNWLPPEERRKYETALTVR